MLAGLAMVLPKNVWQYVAQIPRMASLGKRFVLPGGTQYNLAAVKAQADYITDRVPEAEVFVHPHPGKAGAIGAALEALRKWKRTGERKWIGLDASIAITYTTRRAPRKPGRWRWTAPRGAAQWGAAGRWGGARALCVQA